MMRGSRVAASRRRALVSMIACAALLGADSVATASGPARLVRWGGGSTPALALSDVAGRAGALADYRGQVVLVNFWATWCEPCLDEMPSMQKLKDRLAGQPFAILAVNYGESEAKVRGFLARLPVDFRVLLDPDRQAASAWKVRLLPQSFVVDRNGQVRYSVLGELDWTGDEPLNAVRALLR
jgi:thiol-disulfide isomerase/thioredoxin